VIRIPARSATAANAGLSNTQISAENQMAYRTAGRRRAGQATMAANPITIVT
jgi:hypothetical protein